MEPRIPRDKAAALHVLGDLVDNPFVAPWVHQDLDGGWIDFRQMMLGQGFNNLSEGEQLLIQVARNLYAGGGSNVDLARTARVVDDYCWRRVIEAQTMLRGLADEMYIGPGDWIDGVPS